MTSRRRFITGAASLLGAAIASSHFPVFKEARADTGEAMRSAPADSLVDFISVQTHLNWRKTVWDQDAWRPLLGKLGVRHTRSILGNRMAQKHLESLFKDYGIRSSATFSAVNDDGTFDIDRTTKILAFLRDEIGQEKVYAVEGPNEYTHRYKTGDWAGRLRDYQEFLWNSVKADSALSTIAVIAPSIWNRVIEDYEAIGNIEAHADFANLHLYNGGRQPSLFNREGSDQPVDLAIADARIVIPHKSVCITETGFNVAADAPPSKWTIPPDIAAKYTLRNIAELFLRRDAVNRVNIYSLIDDERKDDHYGLLDANLNPRPAYSALRNFIALVADPGPPVEARTLPLKIASGDSNLRHLLLHKRDGRYLLMLWTDASSYDRSSASPVKVEPSPATIDFGQQVGEVKVYEPTNSGNVVLEQAGVTNISLAVPDHVQVVEVSI